MPAFTLPAALEAHEPPEVRGVGRDQVRLMVATRGDGRIAHRRFDDLPRVLRAGDLLVINVSATLPAAIGAHRDDGSALILHFATAAPNRPAGQWWVIELRSEDGARPLRADWAGESLTVEGGARVEILAPYLHGARLWLAQVHASAPLPDYLARHGHPIRYAYVPGTWPLDAYQTVYAQEPGSAEMPSAGRPFTTALLSRLVASGVQVAPLTLHTGVSSPEADEAPYPEVYAVPPATAQLVNAARGRGGRVIAVGTTVVRALETVATPAGEVKAGRGWTALVVSPARGLRAVDGLLTGWHEPGASHLHLLEAAAGDRLLRDCYQAALTERYLWHEFGDSQLILP